MKTVSQMYLNDIHRVHCISSCIIISYLKRSSKSSNDICTELASKYLRDRGIFDIDNMRKNSEYSRQDLPLNIICVYVHTQGQPTKLL